MEIELECFKRANGVVEALQAYNDEYLYYLNGNLLKLPESLTFRQHSPTGFSHGYAGSGPAQLALAICLKLYSKATALKVYQYFKTHRTYASDHDMSIVNLLKKAFEEFKSNR